MTLRTDLKIITALLLIVLALVGCGAGGHQEEEKLAPISATDWPTAQPTSMPPTPTPFPKVTLAPRATPTPSAAVAPAEEAAVSIDDLSSPTDLNSLIEQVSAAGGGLSPVAAGLVRADSVPIRQGPDESYGVAGTANRNDLLAVFGTDPSGDWLYVLTVSLLRGWLPAEAVRVTGSLEDAPVLPANPVPQQSTASAPGAASNSTGSSPAGASVAPAALEPVVTARVNNFALNMRQGPGAAYGQLGSLSQNDEVGILAFNLGKDWVLVKTADERYGWVSLPLLAVNGSLEAVPVVVSPTPDTAIPAGQVAPIRLTGQAPGERSAAPGETDQEQIQSSTGPAEVVPASFNRSPAAGTLAPVAIALIGRPEVNLQPAPGNAYAPFKILTQDDERIAILGIDPSGEWVLVNPAWSGAGWISLADLNIIEGSVANAPVAYTGRVESNEVEVRRGPGIYEDRIGSLSIHTLVQVMGLNPGRSWALVRPVTGEGLGWTPVRFLDIAGPLADLPDAPQLPAPGPAAAVEQAAAPALPAVPLAQTKLVFQTSSGGDIMVINGDGSGLRRLTAGIDPVLSPDGQTVAFTRWEGETGSLWTIGIDGSNEKSVLGFIKQAKGPSWSPDSSRIVLNFQHGGRLDPDINCYELDGREPPRPPRNATDFRIKMGPDFDPALCWTLPPDPHWGLRVVNLADGSFEDVDGGTYAFRPEWDPGQPWRIVSDGGRGLVQVDVNDQGNNRLLTGEVNDGSPVFSPDGRYLAVVTGNQGGSADFNIHRINADGSGRVQLTKTPLWVTSLPDRQQAWNNVAPAWSPDGSQIAFLTDRTGRWEIWVMQADGSNQRPMFSAEINNQLHIQYHFVDERVLSWR